MRIDTPSVPVKNSRTRISGTRIRRYAGLFSLLACASGVAQARFRQPSAEYQARRAKLLASVDGPVLIYGYTGHEDASEVAVFFQEPYFYYLTGHDEPGAALLLIPESPRNKTSSDRSADGQTSEVGTREILYLPARDPA